MSEIVEGITPPKERWRHRRRHAYACTAGALLYPFIVRNASPEVAQALVGIAMPFYLFVSSVVGVYIGFATAEFVKLNGR